MKELNILVNGKRVSFFVSFSELNDLTKELNSSPDHTKVDEKCDICCFNPINGGQGCTGC